MTVGQVDTTRADRNVVQSSDGDNRRESKVFVADIQTVQDTQGSTIPSRVWLDDVENEVDDVRSRYLYFSTHERGFQFLPIIPYRKLNEIGGTAFPSHDLACHVIKDSTQVVHRIAEDKCDVVRHRLGYLEYQNVIARIRILLAVKTIKVRAEEFGEPELKLLDVLIGPFDL
jgi:hypothetical protein